jgi:hypothetical protein
LPTVSLTPVEGRQLAAALENRRHVEQLKLAFVGELALAIPVFLNLRELGPDAPDYLPARYGDLKYYLEISQRMISACEGSLPETWQRTHQLQTALQESRAKSSQVTQLLRALTLSSVPSYEAYIKAVMKTAFQCDAGRVALALHVYRTERADYPETLSSLSPDYLQRIPLDPYDNQPLRYRRTADGYVLYSVGPDGQDDQGRMTPGRMEPDIVFQVPLPISPENE